eukprot:352291-Chlamydomonas_euryale.AAC.2
MHAAPRVVHAAPGAMHSASWIVRAAASAIHAAPRVVHAALGAMHAASWIVHAAAAAVHAASWVMHAALGAMHAASWAMHAAPWVVHTVPSAVHAVHTPLHAVDRSPRPPFHTCTPPPLLHTMLHTMLPLLQFTGRLRSHSTHCAPPVTVYGQDAFSIPNVQEEHARREAGILEQRCRDLEADKRSMARETARLHAMLARFDPELGRELAEQQQRCAGGGGEVSSSRAAVGDRPGLRRECAGILSDILDGDGAPPANRLPNGVASNRSSGCSCMHYAHVRPTSAPYSCSSALSNSPDHPLVYASDLRCHLCLLNASASPPRASDGAGPCAHAYAR